MSKLANKIEAVQTGRVKLLHEPGTIVAITEELKEIGSFLQTAGKEYFLGVNLGVKGVAQDQNELVHLKSMAKRQLVEEVFGEFRPMLRKIERALYNRDFGEARTALLNLENEMGL